MPMTLDAWLTLAVLAVILVLLARDRVAPATGVVGAVIVLTLLGVITPVQAFAGFANPATITVAALFVVARAVERSGLLAGAFDRLLGQARGERGSLLRLLAPVAASSTVLNNTPIVATLAPPLRRWAEQTGRAPSRYLMPLSFAAILGGLVTLIGTSATLLVSGMIDQLGHEPLGFLEITPVGAPVALLGVAAIVAFAPRLLPDREDPVLHVLAHEREYTFQVVVDREGPLVGVSVRDAELRDLEGVYLVGLEHEGHEVAPVDPEVTLHGGDVLTFAGQVDRVRDVTGRVGLTPTEDRQVELLEHRRKALVEVVLGDESLLVGQTPKEVSFRGRYGAAIVAIHRSGERVAGKLGEVRLAAGDALLLLAGTDFAEHWRDRRDFLVVISLEEEEQQVDSRGLFVAGIVGAMVLAAATGLVPVLHAVLAAVFLIIVSRTLSVPDARDAIDMDVVLLIGAAIGLGAAIEVSGLAGVIADGIGNVATWGGPLLALAAVLIATMALTEVVSNAAAAALMVPVALQVATTAGADPRAFAIAVAIGASASFLTPIGYQTNTLVYGLGGYRYGDYWRVGLPISLVVVATSLVVIPFVWGF